MSLIEADKIVSFPFLKQVYSHDLFVSLIEAIMCKNDEIVMDPILTIYS